MARYFFDVKAPSHRVRDGLGMDLPDEVQAMHEATLIIWQLLEQAKADGRPGAVSVGIRTEAGAYIYETSTCAGGT